MSTLVNKVYHYDLKASFGDLSNEQINNIFQDGRSASRFLEYQLEKWFPDLTFVDKHGYDHIDSDGNKYDAKCFTKRGSKFCPSNMIGGGRKVNESVFLEHAKTITYIFCDIIDFPKVKITFKSGEDMAKKYKNGNIPFSKRCEIFENKC